MIKCVKESLETSSNNPVTILSHGFIFRPSRPTQDTRAEEADKSESKKTEKCRHFLSDRDFDDILAACRPRNHGEYMSALPSTLLAVLKIFSDDTSPHEQGRFNETTEANADLNARRDTAFIPLISNMSDGIHNGRGLKAYRTHEVDTLSSSFNSAFSFLRDRKPTNHFISSPLLDAIQIQQLSSLDMPLLNLGSATREWPRSKSDESLSTRGDDANSTMHMKLSEDLRSNQHDPILAASQFRDLMLRYDMSIYDKATRGDATSLHDDAKPLSARKYVCNV